MTTRLQQLLRERSDGIPCDDAVERRGLDRARQTLRAAAAAEQVSGRRRRSTRRAGRFALIVCLAATIAGAIALLPGRAEDRFGPASASAHSLLERSARAVLAEGWRPLEPGQYFHSRLLENFPGHGVARHQPTLLQNGWFAANGYARLVQAGPRTVISGGDVLISHATTRQLQAERRRQRHGGHLRILASSQPYRWADLDYQQLIHLPTDPAKLQHLIEQHAAGSGPRFSAVFSYVATLLGGSGGTPLPPNVSAALYRVIARLPNMQVMGPTRDALGRRGVAIGAVFPHQSERTELILSPATGALLGEREISVDPSVTGAARGTAIGWSAIENEGVVRTDQ